MINTETLLNINRFYIDHVELCGQFLLVQHRHIFTKSDYTAIGFQTANKIHNEANQDDDKKGKFSADIYDLSGGNKINSNRFISWNNDFVESKRRQIPAKYILLNKQKQELSTLSSDGKVLDTQPFAKKIKLNTSAEAFVSNAPFLEKQFLEITPHFKGQILYDYYWIDSENMDIIGRSPERYIERFNFALFDNIFINNDFLVLKHGPQIGIAEICTKAFDNHKKELRRFVKKQSSAGISHHEQRVLLFQQTVTKVASEIAEARNFSIRKKLKNLQELKNCLRGKRVNFLETYE